MTEYASPLQPTQWPEDLYAGVRIDEDSVQREANSEGVASCIVESGRGPIEGGGK